MAVQRLSDLNLQDHLGGPFTPSPAAWEDQVLYFLLLDRFSDGNEAGYRDNDGNPVAGGATPMFQPADAGNAVTTDADADGWRAAGTEWLGGSLAGLQSKVGYLQRLGVTAIWISPVLKQVSFQASYHGYGTQNFLDIDPHFGTAARAAGVGRHRPPAWHLRHLGRGPQPQRRCVRLRPRPLLDPGPGQWPLVPGPPLGPTPVSGAWPAGSGRRPHPCPSARSTSPPTLTPGRMAPSGQPSSGSGHLHPEGPDQQLGLAAGIPGRRLLGLEDVTLGAGPVDDYQPSPALVALTHCYQYWIAVGDLDGFRVDTVKHMDLGAARFFTSAIHEFAQAIGKDNFYLIAEITGDRGFAYETAEVTGMDAALGLADIQDKLEWMVRGLPQPTEYFDLFRNSLLVGKDSHTWFRDKVVTSYDDHDQVRKGDAKARFCADQLGQHLALGALALNATTLGIPCIYYGSEQGFDGHVPADNREPAKDRYIREAMFGGRFGPFRSTNRHSFDEQHPSTGSWPPSWPSAASSRRCAGADSTCATSPEMAKTSAHPACSPASSAPSSPGHASSPTTRSWPPSTPTPTTHAPPGSPSTTVFIRRATPWPALYSTEPATIGATVAVAGRNGKSRTADPATSWHCPGTTSQRPAAPLGAGLEAISRQQCWHGSHDKRLCRGVPEAGHWSCCAFVFVDQAAQDITAVDLFGRCCIQSAQGGLKQRPTHRIR